MLRGGRNGYKDWSFASGAIERAIRQSTRYLFTREVQLTLAESAHQLLKDTIDRLGYHDYFKPTESRITCNINDSSFTFRGLNDQVSKDVKSTEGIDVCVIGEAESLTEKSFNDLDPTIRKPGSEIWIAYNTKMETDFVYQFTVVNPPENMICELVNYTDAPEWMISPVIMEQAERDKRENFPLYLNKWLGNPMTLGLFFQGFGRHNEETPFIIPEQDDSARIIGALDHGIAHDTSFSLYYLSPDGFIHCIFSYDQNGGTTKSHAEAICEAIEACRFSRYMYPCEIYYDYAMDTKHALNEQNYRSDLDEYIEVFASRSGGKDVLFVPANKRKIDGCHSMQLVFSIGDGVPIFRYFAQLNEKTVESIKGVETDKVNTEQYMKMDGDDGADKTRYGIMGALTKMQTLNIQAKKQEKRATMWKRPEPLTKQYGLS